MGVGRFFGAVRVMLLGAVLAGSAGGDRAGCAASPVLRSPRMRVTGRPWLGALCALAAAGVWASPAQAITYMQTTLPFSGLHGPSGVAIDRSGNVFVADSSNSSNSSNSRVVELLAGGGQITLPFSGLNGPSGVAIDRSGDVFVADTGNRRVVELPAGGTQITLPFSRLIGPSGVAVDGSDDVFVTDSLTNRVLELSPGGAQTILPFGGLDSPSGVAVDESDDVFVADTGNSRVVELPAGSAQAFTLPFSGLNGAFSGLNGPSGVAVDGSSDLFVTDSSNSRLLELPAGGTQVALPFSGLNGPFGVAVDGSGDVFLTNGLGDAMVNDFNVLELSPSVPSGTLTFSPSAGSAGTTLAATSVSPCPTGGTFGSATARMSLVSSTGAVLNTATVPVDAAGNWAATLTVPRGAGPDFVGAKCLAASGLVAQIYALGKFTVTPGLACNLIFNRCVVSIKVGFNSATIASRLLQGATVGILVQRIEGKRLVTIGRVPFGHHRKGRLTLRWDLRVNGRTLPKGRYLITLRSLGAHRNVIAATAPVKINIHPKGHGTVTTKGINAGGTD